MKATGGNPEALDLTESAWSSPICLSEQELSSLRKIRQEWVNVSNHWSSRSAKAETNRESFVIEMRPERDNLWSIKVNDAVGAIDLGTKVLLVHPKIPIAHFAYIAERALVPADKLRFDKAALAEGQNFLELVATWTLFAIEGVLREGLIRGYTEKQLETRYFQGKVDLPDSTLRILRGDITFSTRIDEYAADNALNRVLKHVLRFVKNNSSINYDLRSRSIRALKHFNEVGAFMPADMRAVLTRNSLRYEDALGFAKHLLLGTGRSLSEGSNRSNSFLYKTPGLIEEGIRRIIKEGLAPTKVIKTSRQMATSPKTRFVSVNPDLAFEQSKPSSVTLVGDIKYKLQEKDWRRTDLAQAVFFAAAFESPKALVVDFVSKNDTEELGDVAIGKIAVSSLSWDINAYSSPAESEKKLVAEVSEWLDADKLFLIHEQ